MKSVSTGVLCLGVLMLLGARNVLAHCDSMDGPVVKAAQQALETGDVNRVLIWIQQKDEGDIRKAFQETLAVRKLSSKAQELSDRYFFETLVRIHRAGEGAPFTGLKPAGLDLGPAIPAADRAVEQGNLRPLQSLLVDAVQTELKNHFQELQKRKSFKSDDVTAGRRYVEAYVVFIHYAEQVYRAAGRLAQGHLEEDRPVMEHEGH